MPRALKDDARSMMKSEPKMVTRTFLLGIVILFFGIQLRSIDSFVLNEKVTGVINRQIEKREAKKAATQPPREANFFGLDDSKPSPAPLPKMRRITPPRWLGYSLLSIGAVLVLTCPLYRR